MKVFQAEISPDMDFKLSGVLRRMKAARQRGPAPKSRPAAAPAEVRTPAPVKEAAIAADVAPREAALTSAERWPLPGLAPMTRVTTSFGEVHAIALREGDCVQTRDGEFRPIVWLNRVLLDAGFLASKPDSNPVEIRAGAVAKGVPSADIMVSPRQIISPAGTSGRQEAASFSGRPGVQRRKETGLSYTMFHVGAPADVLCEGVYLRFELPAK